MRRIATAFFILLSAAAALGAQGAAGEWVKYTSPEGRYSVRLPKEPTLSTQDTTAATGDKLKQHLAQATDSNSLSMIGYFDYTSALSFNFDRARDGMVDAVKGTLLSERAVSLGGNPGREVKVSAKLPAGPDVLVRARFFNVAGRVYVVQFMFLKSNDTPALAEKCEKFLDSFKVETGQ